MKSNISLFSRLLIATRSRLDVDMKKCLSQYEFSTVPKSVFAQDGSMHHCLAKYKLAEILKNLPKRMCTDINNACSSETVQVGQTSASEKVAIVDGMAQLHCITKPISVKTCHDFALYFSNFMDEKYRTCTEVHLIFDSYKSGSLKTAIRDHRQRTTGRTQYKILPATNISNTPLRQLSHEKTKDELTRFLADYFIKHGSEQKRNFVVSWQDNAAATHTDVTMLQTSKQETDTKILLHAAFCGSKRMQNIAYLFY